MNLDWQPTIRTGLPGACDNSGGSCVDTAHTPDGGMALRHPDTPDQVFRFSAPDWAAFVRMAAAEQLRG